MLFLHPVLAGNVDLVPVIRRFLKVVNPINASLLQALQRDHQVQPPSTETNEAQKYLHQTFYPVNLTERCRQGRRRSFSVLPQPVLYLCQHSSLFRVCAQLVLFFSLASPNSINQGVLEEAPARHGEFRAVSLFSLQRGPFRSSLTYPCSPP